MVLLHLFPFAIFDMCPIFDRVLSHWGIAAACTPEPNDHLGANVAIEGWVAFSPPGIFSRVPCRSHMIARAVDVGG